MTTLRLGRTEQNKTEQSVVHSSTSRGQVAYLINRVLVYRDRLEPVHHGLHLWGRTPPL